jgi:ferredoxin-NADP reductase
VRGDISDGGTLARISIEVHRTARHDRPMVDHPLGSAEADTAGTQSAAPRETGHRIEQPEKLDVVVAARREVCAGVVALELVSAGDAALPAWDPGAHIDVILDDDLERQYSLCGDPEAQGRWRVAVLRDPASRGGSARIHDAIKEGDVLRVRGPRNNFPVVDAESHLFIAGGIGITPLLPMVRTLDARAANWRLVYGGRRHDSMAFLDELAEFGERVSVWPEDACGLLPLAELLDATVAGTAVYCCGPEALLAAVEQLCASWPARALHVERFAPRPDALDGESRPLEVILDDSGVTLHVAADQTILEACDAAGIDVPSSCREGTCGTCETAVLEGVPDHRDSFLNDDERAMNESMMICCSRALTPSLRLDL